MPSAHGGAEILGACDPMGSSLGTGGTDSLEAG